LHTEVFVMRKHIPVQVRHAAHVQLGKNLTYRPALVDQFDYFGFDVGNLLICESSARPA
jgi:hypothetical protein